MRLKKKWTMKNLVTIVMLVVLVAFLAVSCRRDAGTGESAAISADASAIAEARGLTPADIAAALKTYTPSGSYDDYIMFASGGHSGLASRPAWAAR